jgi:sugar (pentulose or hexulose) kinase
MSSPVILIFDVGKTNKKLLLFNEQYEIVYEESIQIKETKDEDDFPCEDVHALTDWIKNSFDKIINDKRFDVRATNFSAYGASFVNIDKNGKVITPLYNYLKPYPEKIKQQFYAMYGDENVIARETASPVLGSLNSGLQLYRLKYEKPELFKRIAFAFHLPQYLSYVVADYPASEITSIGCHTNLWDFQRNNYHSWVLSENIDQRFAPILDSTVTIATTFNKQEIQVGIGLHDSSAALIPYLKFCNEPFVLISTGTWCISLNPFNSSPLTEEELKSDCLCYLTYEGKPVKASRLFAGYEHEMQTKYLSQHFSKATDYYKSVRYDAALLNKIKNEKINFQGEDLKMFESYEEAYHALMANIITNQVASTNLILNNSPVKKIFVDGGFSTNEIYMRLLAGEYDDIEIFAAAIPHATAFGAAIVLHTNWNRQKLPENLIGLKLIN